MSLIEQPVLYPTGIKSNIMGSTPVGMNYIYPPSLHPILKTSQATVIDLSTFKFEDIGDDNLDEVTVKVPETPIALSNGSKNWVLSWVSMPFQKSKSSGFSRLKYVSPFSETQVSPKPSVQEKIQLFIRYVSKNHLVLARSKRDLAMLLYSFCYLFLCTFLVCLANTYADRMNTNAYKPISEKYVAPDMLLGPSYKVFASSTWIPKNISDVFVQMSFVLILVRVLLLGRWTVTVVRRGFYIIGTLYLLRAPMVVLTVLPTPWVSCVTDTNSSILSETMQLLSQQKLACGDVFFSGHSIIFTSLIFVYWIYNRPCSMLFKSTGKSLVIPPSANPFYDVLPSSESSSISALNATSRRVRCRSSAPALTHFSSYPTLPKLKSSSLQLETLQTDDSAQNDPALRRQNGNAPLNSAIPLAEPAKIAYSNSADSCIEHPPTLINSVLVNISINILVTLFAILGMYSLIFSSYHYTIDVLSGFIFTATVWTVYHWMIRVRQLREETWLGGLIWKVDDPEYQRSKAVSSERNQSLYFTSSAPKGYLI